MMRHPVLVPAVALAACLALTCLASPAVAQVASALLREASPLPDEPTETVAAINNPAANHAGGYAFLVNTTGSGTTLSHAWGNAAGGPGALIRTEAVIGDYDQSSYESFFGFSDAGNVAYSPISTHIPSGTTGIDGVWVDDTPIMNEEDPYPNLAGYYWTFGSRAGITADGQPYWAGGISNVQGGSTQIRGIFFGAAANEVLMSGDSIGGISETVATSGIDFDYRFSALGTNYITPVTVNSGSTLNDGVMVMNGNAMLAGGSIMREDSPVPASIGGLVGENWDNFDFVGVTESGDYLVTGDTNAATSNDEFVLINGLITYREGDAVAGGVYAGNIEGAYLNENGDVAYTWEISYTPGVYLEALFFNGDLLLTEGDLVDWNNDGIIDGDDNGAFIDNFTGISALVQGDQFGGLVDVYFTADVDVKGTILEGGFRYTVSEPIACTCGDIDRSGGAVDLNDFATFALCFGLSGPNPPGCDAVAFECSDMNADGIVELNDFATFALWFGLQTTQSPPNCGP